MSLANDWKRSTLVAGGDDSTTGNNVMKKLNRKFEMSVFLKVSLTKVCNYFPKICTVTDQSNHNF